MPSIKKNKYNYFPQTKEALQDIINKRIREEGNEVNLNDIDVSNITNMSYLFEDTDFNGDVSNWDVSNVTDMHGIFCDCDYFNKDISNWNISNVKHNKYIFICCPIKEKYKPKFN